MDDFASAFADDPWDDRPESQDVFCTNGTPENPCSKPTEEHLKVLQKYFGHAAFRNLQWQIIHSLMVDKKDNCIIMATGYGKSLCYQYPAVFKNGLSVVVSPLISLMEDQVKALKVANIPACLLGTAQSKKEEVIEDLIQGIYRVVYITPEYATADCGSELIQKLQENGLITLLAIDEAHCVSQWGHDFRPAYKDIGKLRKLMPNVPVLAVTATATVAVREDIIKLLMLNSPQLLCSGFDRPNLYFKVEKKSGDPYVDIMKVLNGERNFFNISHGSVIIYCLTKKITESVAELLSSKGIKCQPYHAGIGLKKRKMAHDLFINDEIKVMVATIAFGMGIDKPNVRCVIHYGSSANMEGYYQEAGRAGRDGDPSVCILFHAPADFQTHFFLQLKSRSSNIMHDERKASSNMTMQNYVLSRECRRYLIMSYFDKSISPPTTPSRDCCDNCTKRLQTPNESLQCIGLDSKGMYDFSEDGEKFLKAVNCFLPKAFGVVMVIALLRGSKAKKLPNTYYSKKAYGSGASKSDNWWKQIAIILEMEGLLKKELRSMGDHKFNVLVVTQKGLQWLDSIENQTALPLLLIPNEEVLQCLKLKSTSASTFNVQPMFSLTNTNSCSEWNSKSNPKEDNSNLKILNKLTEKEEELLNVLFDLRHKLAKENDVIPHTIVSDVALNQIVRKRPSTLEQLTEEKFDGMSDMKIGKFGKHIVDKINEFCQKNPPSPMNVKDILKVHLVPPSKIFPLRTLNATQQQSVEMFNLGKTPEEIASERSIVPSTVYSHLAFSLKTADAVDVDKLITAPKLICIANVIKSSQINNDMSRTGLIKQCCPLAISYEDIKISIAYLETRIHLQSLNIPFIDDYSLNYEEKCFQSKLINNNGTVCEKNFANNSRNCSVIYRDEESGSLIEEKASDENEGLWEDDFPIDVHEIDEILDKSMDCINEDEKNSSKQNMPIESFDTKVFEPKVSLDEIKNIETGNIDNVDHFMHVAKKQKICSSKKVENSTTDVAVPLKLPSWMSNAGQTKKVMKAKMSKNSLFN